ncbi:MAG: SurA N-terminal domain-containing protein [Xanthobacteraceae bacterium]
MIQRKLPAVEGEQEAMPHILVRARTLATAALVLLSALAFVPMCSTTARAQQVVLLVDGQPITALDIEQRTKFIEMSARRTPPRQEVIDGLINELLEIREAKRYTIDPAQSDVDDAFNNIATHMNVDGAKLTQILAAGGASAGTLKQKLRAEMSWSSLVRGRFKASLEIADSDVETQMHLHDSDSPSQVGYEYILRPVLLVVPRGSPDSALDARKKEAEALRARFSDCASGVPFARALREVAVRDPVSKSSADFSEELRAILDKTDLGHLTPPEQTNEGVQMFAVCSKKETKNDSPGMQKMRDQLFEQKFGAKAKHYLADLRHAAMIEYK